MTVMRKHTNTHRRRCQRTRTNGGLREQRKTRYIGEKSRLEASIKKGETTFMEGVL
jgi:hypothetical protein